MIKDKFFKVNPKLYIRLRDIFHYAQNIKKKRESKRIYMANKAEYLKQNKDNRFLISTRYERPCLEDRFEDAGSMGCYFWQDLWAARLVKKNNPTLHYDIASRVDGFIGMLSAFSQKTKMIDIRPLESVIPDIDFFQADATTLEGIDDESVESISALCSLEHFGLGRYGDTIDPNAWYYAMKSIVRVIKPGGHAYIAVPVGQEHLEFDAHRVFYASTVAETFEPMKLIEFSTIHTSDTVIEKDVPIHKYDDDESIGGHRFGLFHFVK